MPISYPIVSPAAASGGGGSPYVTSSIIGLISEYGGLETGNYSLNTISSSIIFFVGSNSLPGDVINIELPTISPNNNLNGAIFQSLDFSVIRLDTGSSVTVNLTSSNSNVSIGNIFSSPNYSFSLPTSSVTNFFVVQTGPGGFNYVPYGRSQIL